jgi:hypothetical protein
MIEPSDLNDGNILAMTRRVDGEDNTFRYEINLPGSERLVHSEWMASAGQSEGKLVLVWCEMVRDQVKVDLETSRAERKAKSAGLIEYRTEDPPPPASERQTAVEYARDNRDRLHSTITTIEKQIRELQAERSQLRADYENWETIVSTLRGEQDD